MSQFDYGTIDPNTKSGPQLALDLNDFRDALNTQHKGNLRPSYAQPGMQWVREVSSTQWDVMFFDGDTDYVLRSVNPTTNTLIRIPKTDVAGIAELETTVAGLDAKYVTKDSNTGAANIPVGTSAQRPAVPAAGMFRYNSSLSRFERRNATTWLNHGDMDGPLNEATVSSLDSASVNNVSLYNNTITITGTTTITSLGTANSGIVRRLVFTTALQITHNATSLILPGAANITTAAGDVAEFVSLGSGNWRCLGYQRADGTALVPNGLGVGQTWQDVTGSRVLGTTYTNNTGRPISISGYVNNSSGGRISIAVGGVVIWNMQAASGVPPMPFSAVIPIGATYAVTLTTGSGTLAIWAELR